MRSFDYVTAAESLLTARTTALLTAIHEARGRYSVQALIKPDYLGTLTAVARIQSTDASNRIEGIATSNSRLNALIERKTTPRNRNEEEIAGYRDVLATIHDSHDYIPLTPNVILQLHRDLFRHTPLSFAGRFKDSDNVIVEQTANGERSIRFAPPAALATPELVADICNAYDEAIRDGHTDALLVIAMFVFDFTCIHPFNDGNGRMSRLLTLLALYRNGYEIGKYISIEQLIERSKDTYYDALAGSTAGWNDGTNDYAPFVNYLLGVILAAYREFDDRVGELTGSLGAQERVASLIERELSPLSKADILARLPDISVTTVERALKSLHSSGRIEKIGAGRATRYAARRAEHA